MFCSPETMTEPVVVLPEQEDATVVLVAENGAPPRRSLEHRRLIVHRSTTASSFTGALPGWFADNRGSPEHYRLVWFTDNRGSLENGPYRLVIHRSTARVVC